MSFDFVPGVIQSPPDHRDYIYGQMVGIEQLPTSFFWDRLPVRNQGQFGTCHDAKTQVLTSNGWKFFAELTGNEMLATVNPENGEMFFEKPTRLFKIPYVGEMLHIQHHSLDAMVTPDHMMLVRKWDEQNRRLADKYEFVPAKDLGWYSGLMNNLKWTGKTPEQYCFCSSYKNRKRKNNISSVPMRPWLRFLGMYVADGTLVPSADWCVQIAAAKSRKRQFLDQCLTELGLHASKYSDRYHIHSASLCNELIQLGFKEIKAPQKKIPSFIFELSAELIEEFLSGFAAGDGYVPSNGGRVFYTSSAAMADQIQQLIIMSGKWAVLRVRNRIGKISSIDGRDITANYPSYEIYEWKSKGLSIDRKEHITTEHYNSYVFCAEVPTFHTLITRRNGKVLVAGNCVGFASAAVKDRQEAKNYPSRGIRTSPLFVYDLAKRQDGIPNQPGTYPRVVMSILKNTGVCLEQTFPYSLMADVLPEIPATAYDEAKQFVIGAYAKVQTLDEIKHAIATQGPVLAGVMVTQSFISAPNGVIPVPSGNILGGHAICIDGYDDSKQMFRFANSWGESWSDGGYGWIPYSLVNWRADTGMPFLMEAWSSVDVILPPPKAREIILRIGSNTALVDGKEVFLDQPPVINPQTGRTLLPIRFIAEVFGWQVEWNAVERKVTLTRRDA